MQIRYMLMTCAVALAAAGVSAETLTFDQPQCAGLSGFRAHWDKPIPVSEDGARTLVDSVVKDRGQTAVWGGEQPGPLAFDAVHRSLLIRFPGSDVKIAEALAEGMTIAKVELVLPYLDEEIWPTGSGGADYPSGDGYRYRQNWGVDKLYREKRPNWHAVAHMLRKPWMADATNGPTYNAAINGAVYWRRFGASDTSEDRFPAALGPAEVSSYKPEGRMDVTAVVNDAAFGASLEERLHALANFGFVVQKEEVYDARFTPPHVYEWAISTGPRAVLIKKPSLVVTLQPGAARKLAPRPAPDVPALAARHGAKPLGAPTAVVPSAAAVAKLNERFMAKPAWMPDWQYAHVLQLMGLESGGKVLPFYYRLVPGHVSDRTRVLKGREAAQRGATVDIDYEVYLAWLDWVNGCPPRFWEGHLTAANNVTQWYNYRDAIPEPVKDAILLSWNAWLMPDRESELDPNLRRFYDNTSGKLVHPMVDDPRVGRSKEGKTAEWNQGDIYYQLTGDWRGNKSYYRSGFTREMSTANFNSSASSGALLNGQILGSKNAMADGRAGLMQFPFWMWTHSGGVGQEYIDHYYWAIATASNKNFPDFCAEPEDRMAGWSIITKTVNDLAGAYHPNLRKLFGPASRTYYEHVLGTQDGLYHILHVLSPRGALTDAETTRLEPLGAPTWGHDFPPANVALQTLSGPWADPWVAELVDEKPLPYSLLVEKKVVAEGDWVTTFFGENYGLSSIRATGQRIHVLGQWRRKAELPRTLRDIGTLDMRIGFNDTTLGNDGEGIISQQGFYRCYQSGNRLIMLARPNRGIITAQAGEHNFGIKRVLAQDILSVQCTAALFNYETPAPTWEIFIDDQKVASLPATARQGQVVLVRDGVSYLALRPLPTDDLGRDADVTLDAGKTQTQAHHENTTIRAALLVNANFYRREVALPAEVVGNLDLGVPAIHLSGGSEEAMPADAIRKLDAASSGFIVEMGDEKEYGSFTAFRKHILGAKLTGDKGAVTYTSGKDALVATWDSFTVNGVDPCAYAKERNLWQDTTLTQMGRARLEKNGAVIEREASWASMFLQTFPKQKIFVAMNLLPNYLVYTFREPGGVTIRADGALSMGRWAVKDSREIDIKYHAFGGECAPKEPAEAATVLFIAGTKGQPQVVLNGKAAALMPWKQGEVAGWLVPLGGAMPKEEELAARLEKNARQ